MFSFPHFISNGYIHALNMFGTATLGIIFSYFLVSSQFSQSVDLLQKCAAFDPTGHINGYQPLYNWKNRDGVLNPTAVGVLTSFFQTNFYIFLFSIILYGIFNPVASAHDRDVYHSKRGTPHYQREYPKEAKVLYKSKCLLIFRVIVSLYFYIYISYRLISDFIVIQSLTERSHVEPNDQNGFDYDIVNPPTEWRNFFHFYVVFTLWWISVFNAFIWMVAGIVKYLVKFFQYRYCSSYHVDTADADIEMSNQNDDT